MGRLVSEKTEKNQQGLPTKLVFELITHEDTDAFVKMAQCGDDHICKKCKTDVIREITPGLQFEVSSPLTSSMLGFTAATAYVKCPECGDQIMYHFDVAAFKFAADAITKLRELVKEKLGKNG